MASQYLPDVSFKWLADLPDRVEATQLYGKRKETLASLKGGSADELLEKGSQLLAAGDTDFGLKLIAEGRQRKAIDQRSAQDMWYMQNIAPMLPGFNRSMTGTGGEGPGTPGIISAEPAGGPARAPGGAPETPPGGWPAPNLGPRSEAPQGPPPNDIIAAAQAGMAGQTQPMPQPGAQLAQAGGGLPQGAAPPQGQPAWLPGAMQPTLQMPSREDREIQRALQQPPGGERMRAISNVLTILGKGAPAGYVGALRDTYKADLDKMKWSQPTVDWQMDNFDRKLRGERTLSREEYIAETKTVEKSYDSAVKEHERVSTEATKAENLHGLIEQAKAIQQNPDFLGGNFAPLFTEGANLLGSIIDAAKSQGLNVPGFEGLKAKIMAQTNPALRAAALADALTSVTNQAVFAKVGSLGANFSEGDRKYTSGIFPTLRSSKWGGPIVSQMLLDRAEYEVRRGAEADRYMAEKGALAKSYGLRQHLAKWKDENPMYQHKDGTFTDAGARLDEMYKLKGAQSPVPAQTAAPAVAAPPAAAPPAPTPAPPSGDPGRIIYKDGQPFRQFRDGRIVPEGGT